MATKKKLQELLKDRETPKREAVTPVSLYTKPQEDKETESTQVDETTYEQHALENMASVARKVESSRRREELSYSHHAEVASLTPDKQEKDKQVYTHGDKSTSTQVVKYTTHLKQETIKAIKRYAVEAEIKDYEVLQEAIDKYLKGKGFNEV